MGLLLTSPRRYVLNYVFYCHLATLQYPVVLYPIDFDILLGDIDIVFTDGSPLS